MPILSLSYKLSPSARRGACILSLIAGIFSVTPAALAAKDECVAQAQAFVAKAYPSAKPLPEDMYEVDGKRLTLPDHDSIGGDAHAMICRIWPARPELLLVAVPLMTETSTEGMNEGDLEILVLDSSSHEVRLRHRLPGFMSDDAIYITELAFDTARYQLAPGSIAFGLRRMMRGSSRVNPYGIDELWLFDVSGERIRPVAENLIVGRHGGEWDGVCNGEFDELKRVLSMAPSKSGIADIAISDTIVTSLAKADTLEECHSTDTTTTARHRIRFKDGAYLVPEELRGWRE